MNNDKTRFLVKLAQAATLIVQLAQELQVLQWMWWKMAYGPGNPGQITDAEASTIGATAADVAAAIGSLEALQAPLITADHIRNFFKLAR
jgi:hypothetical protein